MPKELPLVEISAPDIAEFTTLVFTLNRQLRMITETAQKINDFELKIDIQVAEPGK